MTFKRVMALGAVAAALAFTGCQDRSRTEEEARAGEQTQPATGGSGNVDSIIPGGSNTIGGPRQDDRPGIELGGTGDVDHDGTGGSGTVHQPGTGDSLDPSGTGGAGGDLDQDNLDQRDLDQRNQLDDQNNIGGSDEEAR